MLFLSSITYAQDSIVKKAPIQKFNISGEYRFYAQHRLLTDPYVLEVVDNSPVYLDGRSILIGDASQLPELTLNISGNPSEKTSFGTDLIVWNQNNGNFDYFRNLLLGINLYGNFNTKYANVNVKVGGIHWHKMTPFTMRSFDGYNRYSIFERNPWDPQFKDIDRRYEDYYDNGAISQDTRWSQQAVQGIILDFTELPLGLAVNMMYGKTQNAAAAFLTDNTEVNSNSANNFVQFFDNTIPNNVVAGRLIKTFKRQEISLNTFNRISYSDDQATERIENHVHTSEFKLNFDKFSVYGELGIGHYKDVTKDLGVAEMASVKIDLHKKLTKIPIQIHAFRISPDVLNNNSEFVNTSVAEATSASSGSQIIIGANGVLQQNGSAMLAMGQMANNRQGVNINADFEIGKLKLSVGNGVAKEIENINSQITYGHAINGLTYSRFWRFFFPSNVGAYNRTTVLYRSVFETVNLTDLSDNGEVIQDKVFNNMETQLKYSYTLFGNSGHLFYFGMYNSVQPDFSLVTVFTEDAYIRYYAHQLENYYVINSKFLINQYIGWERVLGNYATDIDIDTQRPRNQEGLALGFGFDYIMAKNTMLYLRHRYFKFEDRSFQLDQFDGHETTVELKITF